MSGNGLISADVLGNFVNRVLTFCAKPFGEKLPAGSAPGEAEQALGQRLSKLLADYEHYLEEIELRTATTILRAMWSLANEYINDRALWAQIKTDPDCAALTLRTAESAKPLRARA